jgi:hypothetical protein
LKYRDLRISPTACSHPLRISSLLLTDHSNQMLVLVNHTITFQRIKLPADMKIQSAWLIDETTLPALREGHHAWQMPSDPSLVSLNPLAIAFLRLT